VTGVIDCPHPDAKSNSDSKQLNRVILQILGLAEGAGKSLEFSTRIAFWSLPQSVDERKHLKLLRGTKSSKFGMNLERQVGTHAISLAYPDERGNPVKFVSRHERPR